MPQRVLITAGAAGIGREFARAFAAADARVFVCDIDAGALDAIAKEIPGLIAQPCDMSRRAEIERMVPDAVTRLGGLNVLINNAGISGMTLPVADYPPDDWDKVIAVNLTAMFDVTRLAIPHLKRSRPASSSICRRWRALRLCQQEPLCRHQMGRDRFRQDAGDRARRVGIRANAIAPGAVAATASSASSPAAPRSAASR